MIEYLKVITSILTPALKLWRRLLRRYLLWKFKRSSKKPPLDEKRTEDIAYAVLAGEILDARSYRHYDSAKINVACLYRSKDPPSGPLLVILEQLGGSFPVLWKSKEIVADSIRKFEVTDFDGDGYNEVTLESASWGTGAHTMYLGIYFHRSNQFFLLSEHYERQNLSGPIFPKIEISPTPPTELKGKLEAYAVSHGFLQPLPEIDWDSPKYAVQRWHRDNGPKPDGTITLTFYDESPGLELRAADGAMKTAEMIQQKQPGFASSAGERFDDGEIVWAPFFKNPLMGYHKLMKKYFIAYSPANFYAWVVSLAHDGKRLWFTTHDERGLFSFEFNRRELFRHISVEGVGVDCDTVLKFVDEKLEVGGRLSLSRSQLDELCRTHKRVPN